MKKGKEIFGREKQFIFLLRADMYRARAKATVFLLRGDIFRVRLLYLILWKNSFDLLKFWQDLF